MMQEANGEREEPRQCSSPSQCTQPARSSVPTEMAATPMLKCVLPLTKPSRSCSKAGVRYGQVPLSYLFFSLQMKKAVTLMFSPMDNV